MSKPSVLIATPAFGGMLTTNYVDSLLNTIEWLGKESIPFMHYTLGNESLITRGRNNCAMLALHYNIDKLLFIDADIGWRPEDVMRLYYSKQLIVGGAYPVKTYPISLNFNPLHVHKNEYFTTADRSEAAFLKFKEEANDQTEVEVEHIATGFMMIDLKVLRKLKETTPEYSEFDLTLNQHRRYYDFFKCGEYKGQYESEDWYFCRKAREADFSIWLQMEAIVTHSGFHTFKAVL